MNLELRNKTYHVTLLVPKDVRVAIGKFRFRQSLKTGDRQLAILRAAPLIHAWKLQIGQVRGTDPYLIEAEIWRNELKRLGREENTYQLEAAFYTLSDRTEEIENAEGTNKAREFFALASGNATPFNILLPQWESQLETAKKTKEQMVKDTIYLGSHFLTLESVSRKTVHDWAWGKVERGENTQSSIARILTFTRNYWKFLQRAGLVDLDNNPLNLSNMSRDKRKGRNAGKIDNQPYSKIELQNLYSTALSGWGKRPKCQHMLAALIKTAAYTGARIEELCSLQTKDVFDTYFRITEAKTSSGVREVPIHSHLEKLFKSLKESSKDGYLFHGLTFNKYGNRSNAIGKLFGRLKESLGFDQRFTFHSLRSTFVTALENMEISENTTADIVGHKKPRITYGLYSSGTTLELKAKAIRELNWELK